MLELKVTDLKQFIYCSRIPYYQHFMSVTSKSTYKMEAGKDVEIDWVALEWRRTFSKYSLDDGHRHFSLRLSSRKLALSGIADMVIEGKDKVYPVDCKASFAGVFDNQKMQLAAYAFMLEERFGKPCDLGFIYFPLKKEVAEVVITGELKRKVVASLEQIRHSLDNEILPPATETSTRCAECEYRNFCGDVF